MRFRQFGLSAVALSSLALVGCSGKTEEAAEAPAVSVETPVGDVEVEADAENGTVSVDVEAPAE